jgi:hypothetical protein
MFTKKRIKPPIITMQKSYGPISFEYIVHFVDRSIFHARLINILLKSHIFKLNFFSCLSLSWPCLVHSRLFYLAPSILFPPFCLFRALGFRHFLPPLPSGMSLVLSCLAVRRPLSGGKTGVPVGIAYTNHKLALP